MSDCATVYEACNMDYVSVPAPVEDLVTERVLVTSELEGMPYDRAVGALGEPGEGERLFALAIGGVLRSALLHGIFHGDLHAGTCSFARTGASG